MRERRGLAKRWAKFLRRNRRKLQRVSELIPTGLFSPGYFVPCSATSKCSDRRRSKNIAALLKMKPVEACVAESIIRRFRRKCYRTNSRLASSIPRQLPPSPMRLSRRRIIALPKGIAFALGGKKLPVLGKNFPFSERLVKPGKGQRLSSPLAIPGHPVLPLAVWRGVPARRRMALSSSLRPLASRQNAAFCPRTTFQSCPLACSTQFRE
jgi:hypothetical protein